MDNSAKGMDAEDEEGLIPCVKAEAKDVGLLIELSRPCGKQVRFHMMWRTTPTAFQPRGGMGFQCFAAMAWRLSKLKVDTSRSCLVKEAAPFSLSISPAFHTKEKRGILVELPNTLIE